MMSVFVGVALCSQLCLMKCNNRGGEEVSDLVRFGSLSWRVVTCPARPGRELLSLQDIW